MNRYLHSMMISLGLLLILCSSARLVRAQASNANNSQQAFESQKFPWYDQEKGQFKPLKVSKEPPATPRSDSGTTSSGWVGRFLLWFLLLLLVLAIVAVALQFLPGFERVETTKSITAAPTIDLKKLEALPEPVKGVKDLLAEAQRFAEQAAFDRAMICYYSWQLLQLDREQFIELQKAKTNRQYLREVRKTKSDLLELFHQSIHLFEETFFGGFAVSQNDFEQVWNQRDRFTATKGKSR